MLRVMREQAGSWLIKILLGAIVIVFVFWGVGSFRAQKGLRAAVVNGEVITADDYRDAYNNLLERLRQSFGNNLNDDLLKTLRVKEQALNQLIDNRLLVQEAQRLKFRVSDEELAEAIMNIGAFQAAGTFNSRLYQNVLERLRMSPEDFEVAQREAMLIEKLRTLISGSAKVSDQEAREWYRWKNASVNIDLVWFEPDSYKDIKATGEEIRTFFEENKTSYKTDPQVKVRYLKFNPDAYKSKVTVTDYDIGEYYVINSEEFKKAKTVEARHILLRLDQNADPQTVEQKRNKALDILKMARGGKDFAELAQQYSEGPTKDKGGYLGEFRRENMVKPFADRAFSMDAGEIDGPVRTQFGWHIIKVEKVNPPSTLSLSEAKDTVVKKLKDERAKNLAYEEAEAVFDISFEGEDLLRAAEERQLLVMTTELFTKKGPGQGVRDPAKFASAAFDLQNMEISNIHDFGDEYYILQVVEKMPPQIPEFETVKEKVRNDLVKEKQDQKARDDADALLAALKIGESLSSAGKNYKQDPVSTGFFKRGDSVPSVGFESEINASAFKLSENRKLPENVIKGSKKYYVIQFKERKDPDPLGFDSEEKEITQSLLVQKQTRMFNSFLEQIKNNSEITIQEGFLE